MNRYIHIFIVAPLIAEVLILDNYLGNETEFMQDLVAHQLNVELEEKRKRFRVLKTLTKACDSTERDGFRSDITYIRSIDSTISKEQFRAIIKDSLFGQYVYDYPGNLWDQPSKVRALYLNDYILKSLDRMQNKIADLTSCYYTSPMQDSFELVIFEARLREDSIKFLTAYFQVIDRDTPYVDPVTGERFDKDQLKIYEAKIVQY